MCKIPGPANDCRTVLTPNCRIDITLVSERGVMDAYLAKKGCGLLPEKLPPMVRIGSNHYKQDKKNKRVYHKCEQEEIPECSWWSAEWKKAN